MIVPISNGRSIIPLYIPTTSTTHTESVQTSNNANAVVDLSNPWVWVFFGIFIAFVVCVLVYFAKALKELGGK